MKKLAMLFAASLLFAQLLVAFPTQAATPFASPLPPAGTYTSVQTLPIDQVGLVPCALGGVGERVHIAGDINAVTHLTRNATGGYLVESNYNPQGVTGVGLVSGDTYQATGSASERFNVAISFTETFVSNFRVIGQGSGNNYLMHETFHVTVNANFELITYVDNYSFECK
jgi:hypothetical protein